MIEALDEIDVGQLGRFAWQDQKEGNRAQLKAEQSAEIAVTTSKHGKMRKDIMARKSLQRSGVVPQAAHTPKVLAQAAVRARAPAFIIPGSCIGLVIGAGGSRIKQINEKTGAGVTISNFKDAGLVQIPPCSKGTTAMQEIEGIVTNRWKKGDLSWDQVRSVQKEFPSAEPMLPGKM